MEPWYRVATLRKEVREGRSFNPSEFAIHLEQVVAKKAPDDYQDPSKFFARTCFTRALREHAGMVLRRLAGKSTNTAPVLTLITQFGGGKTHTLTALYHLTTQGKKASSFPGIPELVKDAGLTAIPAARVGVFVGNAWDPQPGRETPWIDLARQLAGDNGIALLGTAAQTTPPGTESLARVFEAAGAPVLLLFDEVLNFMNRHRGMAEPFHAFLQNLTSAMTGTTHGAAVISLPRSQVEMTDSDAQWQDRINKMVRRVAKDLIANDETEISEVVRRRLFEDLGNERVRKNVAKAFADWCFERRAQLPSEWTAVDSAATEAKAREFLRARFEACYPFHPATLSVFQRKWQALPQYQQTRGTLAMLAQWIALASRESFKKARTEPLITLGSAPLSEPDFRSVILGQLGEPRLNAAIDADIAGEHSHARALDADSKGYLRDIHQRVGTAILFESSGGQTEKVAHLPELRFALCEPEIDTASIDNAAHGLEQKSYFIRKAGTDGYRIGHQPTLKKVVSDRRASLDEETEIKPAMRKLVEEEFRRGASIPVVPFPNDGTDIPDTPRLTLVVLDPESEWSDSGPIRERISGWTRIRGKSDRLYPASLIWCVKKPGRALRDHVELWLAWKRVGRELAEGTLGADFERGQRAEAQSKLAESGEEAKEEVWSSYRMVVVADKQEPAGLKMIDMAAGHSSSGETLCGRTISALKNEGRLNESIGSGYLDRNWPPAWKESGEWPLKGLRQAFLDGSFTRLIDPDVVLRAKLGEFVQKGEFGLGSGRRTDGTFDRILFKEPVTPEDVEFDKDVYLLKKERAGALSLSATIGEPPPVGGETGEGGEPPDQGSVVTPPTDNATGQSQASQSLIHLHGNVPPEVWNRIGTKLIPKLRSGTDLVIGVDVRVRPAPGAADHLKAELRQIIADLGLSAQVSISDSD